MKLLIPRVNDYFRPEIGSLRGDISRLFDDFFNIKFTGQSESGWLPAMDAYEDENNICIEIDVAGFEDNDLSVSMDNNILEISGKKSEEKTENEGKNYFFSERKSASFSRSITLPAGIDQEDIKCELKNGVLTTTIKKANQAKKEKIQITVNH